MRKLILKMSLSVDGFVAGPNGEFDWVFASRSAAGTAWMVETLSHAGVHVMGSKTYRDMASFWPFSAAPLAKPMNEIPKVAFSTKSVEEVRAQAAKALEQGASAHTDQPAGAAKFAKDWADSRVATGDLAVEIDRMKREPGNDIVAHGGAGFARSLVERELVDEFCLVVHPVSLGTGLSLFGSLSKPLHLSLASSTRFESGVVVNVYRPKSAG